jgi:hypothetical protein
MGSVAALKRRAVTSRRPEAEVLAAPTANVAPADRPLEASVGQLV